MTPGWSRGGPAAAACDLVRCLTLRALLSAPTAAAQAPADSLKAAAALPHPPSGLNATDVPNDAGRAIQLTWTASSDDRPGAKRVGHYLIQRAELPSGPYTLVDSVAAGTLTLTDGTARRGVEYFYRVDASGPGGVAPALSVTGPAKATSEWLNKTRWSVMAGAALYFGFVLFFMMSAQAGRKPFVRKIPGIAAIEEAGGRATPRGRPGSAVPRLAGM